MASSRKKAPKQKSETFKQVKTYEATFTALEIVHLRDLFSVLLPPTGEFTVSSMLARSENRNLVEAKLWEKIVRLCKSANVPIGDEAPDFIVGINANPSLTVYQVKSDFEDIEEGSEQDESQEDNPFDNSKV